MENKWEYKLLKLFSGELIIAKCKLAQKSKDIVGFILSYPMSIHSLPLKDNTEESSIFLKRWIEVAKEKVVFLELDAVLIVNTPMKSIIKAYEIAKKTLNESSTKEDEEGVEFLDEEDFSKKPKKSRKKSIDEEFDDNDFGIDLKNRIDPNGFIF